MVVDIVHHYTLYQRYVINYKVLYNSRQELKVKLDAKQKELEKEARLRRNLEVRKVRVEGRV